MVNDRLDRYILNQLSLDLNTSGSYAGKQDMYRTLDIKGCICHFVKWQIHPLISNGAVCAKAGAI